MQKYRSKVEYDGRHYVGWQRQDNGPSIQAAVEEAILNFCGEQVEVIAAGRTDSGRPCSRYDDTFCAAK